MREDKVESIFIFNSEINSKYFYYQLGEPVGLTMQRSPYYYIGPAEISTKTLPVPNRQYMENKKTMISVFKDKKMKTIKI